jgi:hypothetical protein
MGSDFGWTIGYSVSVHPFRSLVRLWHWGKPITCAK